MYYNYIFLLYVTAIWNYDSYTIKSVAPSSFNCMINVAGKLWCTCNNTIRVLNPCSLDCEVTSILALIWPTNFNYSKKLVFFSLKHTYSVDGEKSLHLAAGGNCTWAVWIACLNNLDLKLYHATKHIILAELNIKQCISQKLTGNLFSILTKFHIYSKINVCLGARFRRRWNNSNPQDVVFENNLPLRVQGYVVGWHECRRHRQCQNSIH